MLCPPFHTARPVDVRPKLTSKTVYQIFWCSPVNQLPDRRDILSLTNTDPMVAIV